MAGAINFENLSIVLLEEPSDWQFVYLSIRHAQIFGIVALAEEVDVVVFAPFFKTTGQILSIPLCIVFLG